MERVSDEYPHHCSETSICVCSCCCSLWMFPLSSFLYVICQQYTQLCVCTARLSEPSHLTSSYKGHFQAQSMFSSEIRSTMISSFRAIHGCFHFLFKYLSFLQCRLMGSGLILKLFQLVSCVSLLRRPNVNTVLAELDTAQL